MTEAQIKELLAAASEVWEYLKIPGEATFRSAVYETPAQSLRRQADELERKEKAIHRFRAALRGAKDS